MTIRRGDLLRHVQSGGGLGDPLRRDPQRVLEDVPDEKLSPEYARAVYGVVLDATGRAVDPDATSRLRQELGRVRPA